MFAIGDEVVIVAANSGNEAWIGHGGIVIENDPQDFFEPIEDEVRIAPFKMRPDGHEGAPYYWPVEKLRKVE